MDNTYVIPVGSEAARRSVRRIGNEDLKAALRAGFDDFLAMPTHVVFAVLLYPVAGILIAAAIYQNNLTHLLFPMASGFALIGPFAAIGLYELSRRREKGQDTSWSHAYESLASESAGGLAVIGLLLTLLFGAWILCAMGLHWVLYGDQMPGSVLGFVEETLTTSRGWAMILIGNAIGFAFSLIALAISVMSVPMLVDRHVDARTAIDTSIAAVQENPSTMMTWGLIVAGMLVLGMLPLFIGLAVVLPILGHATWHLYRRTIVS